MTTNTMVAIDSKTATNGTASITFTSIPQNYTDLMIEVYSNASNATLLNVQLGYNSIDTGAHYSDTLMSGNGSTASSNRDTSVSAFAFGTSRSNAITQLHFMNYSNTTTYKTVLARGSDASVMANAGVGLWRGMSGSSTEAINQILIKPDYLSFTGNCTFTLYGIANADIGAYATGGIITQDSTYYYHAFGSSGTFTPSRALTADILVVAGGGGGGGTTGGGGGAGGLLFAGAQSLASGTGYTCTIGGPGAAGTSNNSGGNGANSSLIGGSISQTAIGGGGGGGYNTWYGSSGGSGGGGDNDGSHTSAAGGSPTSGQGYAGGNGNNGTGDLNGGGGGAGGAGNNGSSAGSGAGGVGSSSYSLWLQTTGLGQNVNGTYYIAGGGGGGANVYAGAAGGYGGGAAGATGGSVGSNATPNTGGGGGGGGGAGAHNGGAGGSGLIIVRYAK